MRRALAPGRALHWWGYWPVVVPPCCKKRSRRDPSSCPTTFARMTQVQPSSHVRGFWVIILTLGHILIYAIVQ